MLKMNLSAIYDLISKNAEGRSYSTAHHRNMFGENTGEQSGTHWYEDEWIDE